MKVDGEKFIPKPLNLAKFNMAKLRDTQTLKNSNVKISYLPALLIVNIHMPLSTNITSTDAGFTALSKVFSIQSENTPYSKAKQ